MRVTPHAYEIEGWGVGELWEADGRLVVAHEAPTKRRRPEPPPNDPQGHPGCPYRNAIEESVTRG